jgi:drug/metabolite transporter (DMT)-like permease
MPFFGEFFALLTAALWSVSSMVFTEATRKIGSVRVNITRLLLAPIYLIIVIWVSGASMLLSFSQILNLVLSGVIGLAIGDSFLFKAFQQIGARLSMLILSSAPGMAAVVAYFSLGEGLSALGIAGIVTTIAGGGGRPS